MVDLLSVSIYRALLTQLELHTGKTSLIQTALHTRKV